MNIFLLSEKDIPNILALYKKDFPDGWTENMLRSGFNGGRLIALGAKNGNNLIGVITASVGLDDADIEGVVIDSAFRKNGVATALIEEVEKQIFNNGVNRILLEVREGNIPARSLYEKVGFKTISVRKKYYADGENALVMLKELSE